MTKLNASIRKIDEQIANSKNVELSPCGHPKSSMVTGTTYSTYTGAVEKPAETGTFSYCGDCASIMTPFSYSEPKQSGYWAIDENPSRLRRWLMWALLGWEWREL